MATHQSLPQSHTPSPLSWTEKLFLATKVPLLLLFGIGSFIRRMLRTSDFSSRNLRRNIPAAFSSNMLAFLSLREMQSFLLPTGVNIAHFCTSHNLRHEPVRLDETDGFPPATLHFIDSSPDTDGNVFLYLHGGGYIFSLASPNTLIFAHRAAAAASAALVVLEYSIAPAVTYPGQLAQAAAALRFLLQKRRGEPARIIVGGDSAGGNLTLAILAHLQSPHPRIAPIRFAAGGKQKLRAALCISPRTNNVCTAPSYRFNGNKDFISPQAVKLFTANWQPVEDDVWATPVAGSKAFWADFRASRLLFVVGGDEVYLSDVRAQAELMDAQESPGANFQLTVCPGEMHDQPIMDFGQGVEDGRMTTAVINWMRGLPSP
ncbi:alpha/beta-hydrolase [Viridothelium virens]|uniref:Alpha/beta-hydrolase n=1 Tax=Viridothelium virens TaxID=1048519 RepID=A0A6A6HMM8_VIRVR|nr:alpha/beta-hydrolase [Viridothelium virens]